MKQMSPLFGGVDGGGSKTLVIVVDAQGRERGRGVAGSGNSAAIGIERAVGAIRAAVTQAAEAAGRPLPLHGMWIGLAGVDRPDAHAALLPHLRPLAEAVRLTNDAELPLAALEGGIGVALIAGTGSIALGRDAHGATARADGWGHILGDAGSGYAIGRAGLRAVARAADGRGPTTTLLDLVLRHWSLSRPYDLIGRIYPEGDKAKIASLAALVLRAARDHDEIARRIVRHAADELARTALHVGAALDLTDGRLPLALAGGLLVHAPDLRAMVLRRVRHRRPVGPVAVVEHPARSAAQAARYLADTST